MAYICENSSKECDGCGKCFTTEEEKSLCWCDFCGERVDISKIYCVDGDFICENCLEESGAENGKNLY